MEREELIGIVEELYDDIEEIKGYLKEIRTKADFIKAELEDGYEKEDGID